MLMEMDRLLENSSPNNVNLVKEEPADSDSVHNNLSPNLSDRIISNSTQLKEREKNVKSSAKKNKNIPNETDGKKLPYVHVRARPGQATDSHSLAERARIEKINARMKLLQEMVPGCNKISGTAMVLDEIINHVQSLQCQVELLSMRQAALHPINLDSIFSAESGSLMDGNFTSMISPPLSHQIWQPDGPIPQPARGVEENPNFITPENSPLSYDSSGTSASTMETFLEEFQHLKIQLEDIKSATDNFDVKKVIGAGGFGKVYKGELSHFKGRSIVALKRLDRRFGQGDAEFWKEIMMLSRYTHENLISLLGYCDEEGEKILVYEHASSGSLDRHLDSTTLTWIQRLKICLDAAKGLSYLHDDKGTQQRVLHRDIKSSNILLDEYWNAKVSDMGLSKIGPANQQHTALVTNVVGTLGYLDPMYMELGILTKESDVYSFGVVLFEVLCGRLCFENNNGRFPSLVRMWKQKYKQKKLDEIIFQDLMQEMDPRSLETFSDIAYQCLQKSREDRPTMSLVVEKLETALNFQEIYEQMKHPLDYDEIIKTAVHPLTYTSKEELKSCLSKGILLNDSKTWFSLNKNGEHCEMISAIECLTPLADRYDYASENVSRFPPGNCYVTRTGRFKAHVRTQFLSPEITYAVYLVFKHPGEVFATNKPCYLGIKYRLQGETKSYFSNVADGREDGWWMAELYQFENERRDVDLEIIFEGSMLSSCYYSIEGIEFRPIEKVERELLEHDNVDMQTISESDDKYWEKHLPNDYDDIIKRSKYDVKWTNKNELYSILSKGFLISNNQMWFSLAKNGKKCLMVAARSALLEDQWKWSSQTESRFEEVASEPVKPFTIVCKIDSEMLSPETTYACYLVYKLPENISHEVFSEYEFPLQLRENFNDKTSWEVFTDCEYIYLLNPQTPVIRPKADQNSHSHNPMNRPKLKGIPQLRNDGWMEVQVWEFQTGTTMETKVMRVGLGAMFNAIFFRKWYNELMVQGIEFRPV